MESESEDGPDDAGPAVSVLIAVYNGAEHIGACLESVFAQTFDDFEVVVVDDGSTDQTSEIVRGFVDDRLRYHRLKKNGGVSNARNVGARLSRGGYLAVLDADDIAMPERLECQFAFMEAHPEISLSGSYFHLVTGSGHDVIARRPIKHDNIVAAFSHSCAIANTTLFIRRRIFLDAGGYQEALNHGEDYRFFADVLGRHRAENIPKVLILKCETSSGLTFRMSAFEHFRLGLSHRFYAIRKLRLGPLAMVRGLVASFGILFVRMTGVDRERLKSILLWEPKDR